MPEKENTIKDLNIKKGFVKRTLDLFKPFWKWFGVVVIILFVIQLLGTVAPLLLGKSVDAITKGDIKLTFTFLLIAACISVFQSQVLWWILEKIQITKLDDHIEKSFSVRCLIFLLGNMLTNILV